MIGTEQVHLEQLFRRLPGALDRRALSRFFSRQNPSSACELPTNSANCSIPANDSQEARKEPVAEGLELSIANEVADLVRLAAIAARPVRIGPSSSSLLEELESLRRILLDRHRGRPPAEIEGLAPARKLYRAFGIDPTRTRPSSEALLRRVLQEKPLPVLSNAVDLCTLLSLEFLLPMGLYDADRIAGLVRLRRGAPGESYPGIRKDAVGLEGRPVLSDSTGPFGNPTSDSLRTCVTQSTRSLWLVLFAPHDSGLEILSAFINRASEGLCRYLTEPGATLESKLF